MVWIRYEDLCTDPNAEYYDILSFFLGTADLEGTNAERRIKQVIEKGSKATQTYSLKDTTRKFNNA